MSIVQEKIKKLRFPLAPFCQDFLHMQKSSAMSFQLDPKIKELFHFLNADHFEFKLEQEAPSHLKKVGVVFSGGQASGGHNVIWGLYDALKKLDPTSTLIGFLNGPAGIIDNKFKLITDELLDGFKNTGGFDLLGSGRTKIESKEQLHRAHLTIKDHHLDALIIIGGDDSNTNAAVLANYLLTHNHNCRVIGVPKTIDGDLKNEFVETSFGFDSASKLFAELIGNIGKDALSALKYYHFIKIMGRSASHLALEVALLARPNLTLISEEMIKDKQTLIDVVKQISSMIIERAKLGKHHGLIVIPEGLIEAASDMNALFKDLSASIAKGGKTDFKHHLSQASLELFNKIPQEIQKQLVMDTDPHGNIQVSLIETEKLLLEMVKDDLKAQGYTDKFSPLCHFFGYEGRCCYPSYFDAIYGYHLGFGAAILAKNGLTGYMVAIEHLAHHPKNWTLKALSIAALLHLEERKNQLKPVIKKALVDLEGYRFKEFCAHRASFLTNDYYQFVAPRQYFGSFEDIYEPPLILRD